MGQYYFRNQILDQLDIYFRYLRRLKAHDPHAYELHRRLGIHIVPGRTVQTFDDWRYEGTLDELDAWWSHHQVSARPHLAILSEIARLDFGSTLRIEQLRCRFQNKRLFHRHAATTTIIRADSIPWLTH